MTDENSTTTTEFTSMSPTDTILFPVRGLFWRGGGIVCLLVHLSFCGPIKIHKNVIKTFKMTKEQHQLECVSYQVEQHLCCSQKYCLEMRWRFEYRAMENGRNHEHSHIQSLNLGCQTQQVFKLLHWHTLALNESHIFWD